MTDRRFPQLERLLAAAQHDPDVLGVLFFGSAAKGQAGPQSDVDVCLVLVPNRARPDRAMLMRKRLEYLKDFNLDVQIFQALPLYIRRRVLRDGKVLLVKDEDRLYEIAYRTMQAFEDFRHIYHDYLEQVARG